jgi:hypothetical protein
MTADSALSKTPPVAPTWRRWFAFLAGGMAWTFHLLSIYAIGEFGCVSGWGKTMFWNVSAVAWMIILSSILLLIVATAAALTGYFDMRKDAKMTVAVPEDEGGVYLSRFGFIFNILFILIIIVETLPVFSYLGGC